MREIWICICHKKFVLDALFTLECGWLVLQSERHHQELDWGLGCGLVALCFSFHKAVELGFKGRPILTTQDVTISGNHGLRMRRSDNTTWKANSPISGFAIACTTGNGNWYIQGQQEKVQLASYFGRIRNTALASIFQHIRKMLILFMRYFPLPGIGNSKTINVCFN
jgi:hypothetical protein